MVQRSDSDRAHVIQEFKTVVNMTPAKLRAWLGSSQSKVVGMTKNGKKVVGPDGPEAVGHSMGRRILAIKAKKVADLDDDDFTAMRKVIGYVHRHTKQRPAGDVTETRWRKSLMNWGHDPLKQD